MENEDDFDEILSEFEKQFEEGGPLGPEGEGPEGGKKAPFGEEGGDGPENESFEDLDELSKMAGVKPKRGAFLCSLDSVALCSMCALCEVPADCFSCQGGRGSFAILDVSGTNPEEDAERLTDLFKGLEIVLILNRDQRLAANVYANGGQKGKAAPPIALYWAPNLESYLIGAQGLEELKEGEAWVSSSSITKEEALTLLKQSFGN